MRTAYNEAPFHVRFGMMGDISEKVFEKVFPQHHRLGLNRPNLHTQSLPYIMRFTPDYLTIDGMVEVMGIGRDKTLKFKIEKMNNLVRWSTLCPVFLFIYDSSRKKYWYGPLDDWYTACTAFGELDHFPDNNQPYLRLHSDNFPFEGIKYVEPASGS